MFLKKLFKSANNFGNVDFAVICLGNPGPKYVSTRHNIGFAFAEFYSDNNHFDISSYQCHALCGRCTIDGLNVVFVLPQTFMNDSGIAVKDIMNKYKLTVDEILVVHDDVNFDPGIIRIKRDGSSGGHNGIKSIINSINGEGFKRIKIGVGVKPSDLNMIDWVLGKVNYDDKPLYLKSFENCADAVELILRGRIDEAMGKYNKKK